MKRSPFRASFCSGAVLVAAASGAQAQTPNPLPANPDTQAPAPPVQLRIEPAPRTGRSVWPIAPAPGIAPMPRMAPPSGVAPMPNLAPGLGGRYSQRMAPMPGANGGAPGATPQIIPRLTPGQRLRLYDMPGTRPDTDLRQYFSLTPTPPPTAPRPDTMVVDGDFLYILRGDTVIKMNKKTLAVVGTTTLPSVTAPTPLGAAGIPGLQKWADPRGNHSGGTHFGIGPAF